MCASLGIAHYAVDLESTFRAAVLEPFIDCYLAARTPSPCVRCNSRVKFGELAAISGQLGAQALATGHFARRTDEAGEAQLRRGRDRAKDQSYFLFELPPAVLRRVIFPLGEMTKQEVRGEARTLGLANAERPDSQEVCFVRQGGSYLEVLERLASGRLPPPGEVVDTAGRVLCSHAGAHRFTVIVPANTFIASSEAITRSGHQVVFADVDPATYTLDVSDARRRIHRRRLQFLQFTCMVIRVK